MTQVASEESVSIADRVRRVVEADEVQLPPLPELTLRLRELLADEDRVDARKVGDLIRNEPAVAASLLRMANSAAFGGLRPISDLNQAIARLGIKRVTSLVSGIQLKGHFAAEPTSEKKAMLHTLWDHSVACALFSGRLMGRAGGDAEEAFLAGLLHDCGRLLVLRAVDHLEGSDASLRVTRSTLDELMEVMHCELGHQALSNWSLPEAICEAALRHEEPVAEGEDTLLTVIKAADVISSKLGWHLEPDPERNLLDEDALDRLHIRDLELATLIVDLEEEFQEVRELF